jgi:serine phosphatase RsbU (regulator of sigma subunit)
VLFPAVEYATTEVPFHPGDRLLLFTDGLTEAPRRRDDAFFGDSELERVVAALPPAETIHRVLDAHRVWIGDAPLSDDVTLIVVERSQP